MLASTRAKHLRVLSACLQAAVFYRFADSNPVRELPPAQRPRPERKEAAYLENRELPRLFAHLKSDPYRTLCLVALKTGCDKASCSLYVGPMSISNRP
jgi:integrase